MKRNLLLLALLSVSSLTTLAKIWRVNNNNGIVANFKTIQEAHDGANSGDTLHVEGSPYNYGGLNCSKKLIIIGPGFFLGENKGLQISTVGARVNGFEIREGSEGSEIMGLSFSNNAINLYCDDITVKRNSFLYMDADPEAVIGGVGVNSKSDGSAVNNIAILQNFGLGVSIQNGSSGILISNNFFVNGSWYDPNNVVINQHGNATTIIRNNIFKRGAIVAHNSNISNNIMSAGTLTGNDNLISNNIGAGDQFGTENGNKSNVDMTTVFEGTGTTDMMWRLKAGSPAIGAGYGSTQEKPIDCGIYGGSNPYVTSGIPPVPTVYFFENQPVGSATDPIDVSVKVRSNN